MKKTVSVLLAICSLLIMCSITGCAAESKSVNTIEIILQINNPNMKVNGVEKPIDAEGSVPVIVNNRTLLPVRAVVEEMGGTVEWNGDTREVTLNYAADEIKLTIDSTNAQLNGVNNILDIAPSIINDRTMLPIRFIAESFKFNVDWEQSTQTVTITKVSEPLPIEEPVATVMPEETPEPTQTPKNDNPTSASAIIYFSATGTTKAFAEKIADVTGADIYEIKPSVPYTSEDLNYNSDCRANDEQNDDSARPEIEPITANLEAYDTIYLGYPIWWGTLPKVIYTFAESYDLSGKTIMPFCTSGSSGIGASVSNLKTLLPSSNVKNGLRGSSSTSNSQIEAWIAE